MTRRFLLFYVAGLPCALEVRDVAEVLESAHPFPLPLVPSHFPGVMEVHGVLTAVLDLASFLGRGRGSRGGRLLVLDAKVANLALLVDGVGALMDEEAILQFHPVEPGELLARVETERGTVSLLQLEPLLMSLEAGLQ